ncbi:class I SAM-dependent methyltransferase [Halobium salinum]|uniref:Class I SAM-dependent methyltransferase n=1 Tax=Halobium salinum TaxID=1364940 RepID=A0ABD5PEK9_9EURY|nr:class I SAM-dependent methyltransferase [Halobium salinum]
MPPADPIDPTDPTDPTDPADRFASTESHYAAHRPAYGDQALDYLRDRFALDDDARVLDLGCGTGQLSIPLAPSVGQVVGVDPNEAMLEEARRGAEAAGVDNAEWVVGSDADLGTMRDDLAPLRLTTMGRSFHWMDQGRTLDHLHGATEPGGGVALVTDGEWLTKGRESWQEEVYAVAADYLDDLPERVDPDSVEYDDPWDAKLEAFGFDDTETRVFAVDREWSVDGVVGYVFSLSFASPATFGGRKEAFEVDLRERLTALGGGPFTQRARVEVISGKTSA